MGSLFCIAYAQLSPQPSPLTLLADTKGQKQTVACNLDGLVAPIFYNARLGWLGWNFLLPAEMSDGAEQLLLAGKLSGAN